MQIIVLVTLLAIGPAILMLVTSFTRIVIVLGLTRNVWNCRASPNQVIIGLSLFLTIFVMSPVITRVNDDALQPYLDEQITQQEAFDRGVIPVKEFMAKQVREGDLKLFVELSGRDQPADVMDVPLPTLIPAFVISEVRRFHHRLRHLHPVPHHRPRGLGVVDVDGHGHGAADDRRAAVQALLFVLVDGWQLLAGSLVRSFVR